MLQFSTLLREAGIRLDDDLRPVALVSGHFHELAHWSLEVIHQKTLYLTEDTDLSVSVSRSKLMFVFRKVLSGPGRSK